MCAHPTGVGKDIDVMFDNFYNHLVPKEAWSVSAPQSWSNTFNGISECHILTWNHVLREIHLSQLIRRYQRRSKLGRSCRWCVTCMSMYYGYCTSGYREMRVSKRHLCEAHYRDHSIIGTKFLAIQEAKKELEDLIYPIVHFYLYFDNIYIMVYNLSTMMFDYEF